MQISDIRILRVPCLYSIVLCMGWRMYCHWYRNIPWRTAISGSRKSWLSFLKYPGKTFRTENYDDSSLLWVDTLCINQTDLQERSHQVNMMGKIYSKADRVLIWLGEESQDSYLAMDCPKDVPEARVLKTSWVRWRFSSSGECLHSVMTALFHRPHWSWLWIQQEITLAIDVSALCGKHSCTWE